MKLFKLTKEEQEMTVNEFIEKWSAPMNKSFKKSFLKYQKEVYNLIKDRIDNE